MESHHNGSSFWLSILFASFTGLGTHKFGIRVPKSVQEAKTIDEQNGDTLWWESICKEMENVRVAFEEFEGDKSQLPPGYQEVGCHMIFDIKMGKNFRRKAIMVAGVTLLRIQLH